MAGKNVEIARLFDLIADLLEIRGDNPFRIRAYRRAAQGLESFGEDVEAVARDGRLGEIPGVGKDLADKIAEYARTGRMSDIDTLQKEIPRGVVELMNVPGVGPEDGEAPLRQGRRPRRRLAGGPGSSGTAPRLAGHQGQDRGQHPEGHRDHQERSGADAARPRVAPGRGDRRRPAQARGRRSARAGRIDPPPEGDGGRRGHPRDVLEARGGHGHVCRPAPGPRRARARRDQGVRAAPRRHPDRPARGRSPRPSAPRSCTSPARSNTTSGSARWRCGRGSRSPNTASSTKAARAWRDDRGGGVPRHRAAVDPSRAAGGHGRGRSGAQGRAAWAGRRVRHSRRPPRPHGRLRRGREHRGARRGGARARLRVHRGHRSQRRLPPGRADSRPTG